MLAVAFVAGTLLAVGRAGKYGIMPNEVVNVVIVIIISSIAGARILFLLEHLKMVSQEPMSIFYVWQGGFSYHGGLLFGFAGALWWFKRKKMPVGRMLNVLVPSVALGYFFVRVGCFLNGCCFGTPMDMPWGVVFPLDSPAGLAYKNVKLHPTQLYSSLSGLMGFFILLGFEKKFRLGEEDGMLFYVFLMFSTLWRFMIEFFRYQQPHSAVIGWLTAAQTYCIVIFLFAILMTARICNKRSYR